MDLSQRAFLARIYITHESFAIMFFISLCLFLVLIHASDLDPIALTYE